MIRMANRIKGITVQINGDTTGLTKALQGVDKNIRNTQTQLKDVEKLLKLDPTNTELLAQKQKLLGEAISDTKTRLDTLKKASEDAAKTKDKYDAWKAKYDPIKQKIGETETKLKELKEQSRTADEQLARGEISKDKYDALQREIKETTDELSTLKKQAKDVSDEFGNPISPEQYDSLQREIVETEQELQNLQTEASKSHAALVKLGEAGEVMENVGNKMATVGTNMTKYVTLPILGLGTAAVKTTADFDASMSKVSAVSGATGEDLEALRAKAREMGSQTKFSASEAADAMNYMAMAGWKTNDMLGGIEGIMNLAAASGEDLATTSDIVTDALTALGMSAGDSAHFADILAAASSNANTNVSLMGESFKYVAPIAGSMGASAEDLSIALGLMANSGIKGSQAGNSLKNALVNLIKPTKQQAAAMQQLGFISTESIQKIDFGKVEKAEQACEDATINLDNAQIKLNDAIEKYGENSSQAKLASNNYEKAQLNLARAQETLAKEQEGVSKEVMGANTLMTDSEGKMRSLGDIMGLLRQKMGKVNVALTDADGNAREFDDIIAELSTTTEGLAQAEQMQAAAAIFGKQNMAGMLAIINASEEDYNKLSDAIYGCEGTAKGMADTMQDNLAGQLTILKSQLQELAISFGEILMPAIRVIVAKLQGFIDKLNAMDPATKETIVKIALVAAAFGPLLVIVGKTIATIGSLMTFISNIPAMIEGASAALSALGGAFGTTIAPILAVVAVIAALVSAFVHLWKTNEDFRNNITAIWNQIKSTFDNFCQGIVDRVNALGFDFENIGEVIKAIWDGLCKFLAPIFEGVFQNIANIFKFVTNTILSILDIFIGIFTGDWSRVWEGIKGIFTGIWDFIVGTIKNIFNTLDKIFGGGLSKIKDVVVNVLTAIKDFFVNIWTAISNKVKEKVELIKLVITTVWNAIHTAISTVLNAIKTVISNVWNAIYSVVSPILNAIKTVVETVFNAIHSVVSSVMDWIHSNITEKLELIKAVFTIVFETIKNTVGAVFEAIHSAISSVMQWIHDNISEKLEMIKAVFTIVFETIKNTVETVWNAISAVISTVIDAISNAISSAWNFIVDHIKNALDTIKAVVTAVWNAISSFISGVVNTISSVISNVWNGIKNTISNVMNTIKNTVSNIWNSVKDSVSSTIGGIKDNIVNGFNKAVDFIKNLGKEAWNWGADIINGIVDGIKSCIGKVTDAVEGVADKIKSFLHFSVPDEGPLTDFESWMPDFMKGLAEGINKSKKYVEKAVSGVAQSMQLTMQTGIDMKLDGISGAMINDSSGGVVNNYYNNDNSRTVNQTNNSPKSLSRLEIYRQTRNALNV